MTTTITCFSCSSKFCEKTEERTFDICQYGISFFNRDGKIETKEPKVPLATIARNLRHEINPILQSIIQQATLIDPNLSTKVIDSNKPLSLIVGSTVILDNFIQMITGVHEFHSNPLNLSSIKIKLRTIVDLNYTTYGIVKENGRTKDLKLVNLIPENYFVTIFPDFIKYIIAVLIDNAWKYSVDNSILTVNISKRENGFFRIMLINQSERIPDGIDIFAMGTKVDPLSKGFGYGLSWVRTLQANYNELMKNDNDVEFKVYHNQLNSTEGLAFQEFYLENVKIELE